jgi:hypothetical protein
MKYKTKLITEVIENKISNGPKKAILAAEVKINHF